MVKKVVFVLGPPNSGKGTQAKRLAKELGFYHFITSKEGLKYIDTHNDKETKRQKELYVKGILYEPEWLVEKVLKERAREVLENYPGIVFDGSPRTLFESEKLYEFLSELIGKENISVIEINVSEDELKKRSSERLVCDKDLNHVISTRFMDLKKGDDCPECSKGVLIKRDLDKVFDIRMEQFRKRTSPGLDFLKDKGLVVTINGEQSPKEVHNDIVKGLKL